MTEERWLAGCEPEAMLEFVAPRAGDRKLRLFAVVCAQGYANRLPTVDELIRVAERYADGDATWAELAAVRKRADRLARDATRLRAALSGGAVQHAAAVANPSALLAARTVRRWRIDAPEAQARSLADIFGNPFRPVAVEPSWLTSTVVALAEGIYRERAFDRLPILADALMDAGCDDGKMLDHCKSERPHVRGCWVVDLLTGRV
jgi:hypothetical protein